MLDEYLTYSACLVTANLGSVNYPHNTDEETEVRQSALGYLSNRKWGHC